MKTLVISDPHGFPHLIENAISEATKEFGNPDKIVLAGDYLDIGPDPRRVMDLTELADEVLWGNHDAAIIINQLISPQDPVSFLFTKELISKIGIWKLCTVVDDILISHAGFLNNSGQAGYNYKRYLLTVDGDIYHFAKIVNNMFTDTLHQAIEQTIPVYSTEMGNENSPLWNRSTKGWLYGKDCEPVSQIVGHTPAEYFIKQQLDDFAERRIYFIDPYSRETGNNPGRYKYALIKDGEIFIREGVR